jgi:hypothetical protein
MTSSLREKLARAIHERYYQRQHGVKPSGDPAMQPWETLREDLKESNRQQADQIPEKLQAIGYDIRPAAGDKTEKPWLTKEKLELLARMEHDRWMAHKIAQGWTYGPVKDDNRRLHPCLLSWEELAEEEKEKDRQAVRDIPELLSDASFEIYKVK